MQASALFDHFDNGTLCLNNRTLQHATLPWCKHIQFEGVELKHLLTSKQTGGQFSYHLVRIAPHQKIGLHQHKTQLETHEVIAGSGVCLTHGAQLPYTPGVICVLPAGQPHEIIARADGLYLFAKFIPALC